MRSNIQSLVIGIVLLGLAVIASSLFTVKNWERGLLFRFGQFQGQEIQPGLNYRIPLMNTFKIYDTRIQSLDSNPESFLTVNKEEILVDSFVKWKIKDLQKFYKAVRTEENAENRLEQKINNSLKEQIAKRTTEKVVAGDRSEIMSVVQKALDLEAIEIGVEVVDVRLKRVDLADQIQSNVYSRMRSERKRIANESRAQGEEKAIAIEASAQRTEVELIAEAEKKAQLIRGEADALATKVFADSFGQDVEFYDFYRSLNAYRETFNSSGDLIVLDPNSDFFKHFNSQVK
ncbi:protease modulator HflC [Arenicella sp. 4NH20-0111]|uniref:protease modulator HflC n=1 Tax=Arenicella sp. 4NH20-0111 TaxID=3127648 RepID=UPI0031054999